MCYPLAVAAAMAAVSAVQSYSESKQKTAQQKYQAAVAENNATAMRQQADLEVQKGQIEQGKVDRERDQLRKTYEAEAGANRSMLAGAGVEMTSGSAADLLTGNANAFADDILVNRYNRAMTGWEAGEKARQANYQASVYSSEASWLKKTAGSTGKSLLTAGITGASTGLSVYGAMGGTFGGAATGKSKYFGDGT